MESRTNLPGLKILHGNIPNILLAFTGHSLMFQSKTPDGRHRSRNFDARSLACRVTTNLMSYLETVRKVTRFVVVFNYSVVVLINQKHPEVKKTSVNLFEQLLLSHPFGQTVSSSQAFRSLRCWVGVRSP